MRFICLILVELFLFSNFMISPLFSYHENLAATSVFTTEQIKEVDIVKAGKKIKENVGEQPVVIQEDFANKVKKGLFAKARDNYKNWKYRRKLVKQIYNRIDTDFAEITDLKYKLKYILKQIDSSYYPKISDNIRQKEYGLTLLQTEEFLTKNTDKVIEIPEKLKPEDLGFLGVLKVNLAVARKSNKTETDVYTKKIIKTLDVNLIDAEIAEQVQQVLRKPRKQREEIIEKIEEINKTINFREVGINKNFILNELNQGKDISEIDIIKSEFLKPIYDDVSEDIEGYMDSIVTDDEILDDGILSDDFSEKELKNTLPEGYEDKNTEDWLMYKRYMLLQSLTIKEKSILIENFSSQIMPLIDLIDYETIKVLTPEFREKLKNSLEFLSKKIKNPEEIAELIRIKALVFKVNVELVLFLGAHEQLIKEINSSYVTEEIIIKANLDVEQKDMVIERINDIELLGLLSKKDLKKIKLKIVALDEKYILSNNIDLVIDSKSRIYIKNQKNKDAAFELSLIKQLNKKEYNLVLKLLSDASVEQLEKIFIDGGLFGVIFKLNENINPLVWKHINLDKLINRLYRFYVKLELNKEHYKKIDELPRMFIELYKLRQEVFAQKISNLSDPKLISEEFINAGKRNELNKFYRVDSSKLESVLNGIKNKSFNKKQELRIALSVWTIPDNMDDLRIVKIRFCALLFSMQNINFNLSSGNNSKDEIPDFRIANAVFKEALNIADEKQRFNVIWESLVVMKDNLLKPWPIETCLKYLLKNSRNLSECFALAKNEKLLNEVDNDTLLTWTKMIEGFFDIDENLKKLKAELSTLNEEIVLDKFDEIGISKLKRDFIYDKLEETINLSSILEFVLDLKTPEEIRINVSKIEEKLNISIKTKKDFLEKNLRKIQNKRKRVISIKRLDFVVNAMQESDLSVVENLFMVLSGDFKIKDLEQAVGFKLEDVKKNIFDFIKDNLERIKTEENGLRIDFILFKVNKDILEFDDKIAHVLEEIVKDNISFDYLEDILNVNLEDKKEFLLVNLIGIKEVFKQAIIDIEIEQSKEGVSSSPKKRRSLSKIKFGWKNNNNSSDEEKEDLEQIKLELKLRQDLFEVLIESIKKSLYDKNLFDYSVISIFDPVHIKEVSLNDIFEFYVQIEKYRDIENDELINGIVKNIDKSSTTAEVIRSVLPLIKDNPLIPEKSKQTISIVSKKIDASSLSSYAKFKKEDDQFYMLVNDTGRWLKNKNIIENGGVVDLENFMFISTLGLQLLDVLHKKIKNIVLVEKVKSFTGNVSGKINDVSDFKRLGGDMGLIEDLSALETASYGGEGIVKGKSGYEMLGEIKKADNKDIEWILSKENVQSRVFGDATWIKVFDLLRELYVASKDRENQRYELSVVTSRVIKDIADRKRYPWLLVKNLMLIKDGLRKRDFFQENWQEAFDDICSDNQDKNLKFYNDRVNLILKNSLNVDDAAWIEKELDDLKKQVEFMLININKKELAEELKNKKVDKFEQLKEIIKFVCYGEMYIASLKSSIKKLENILSLEDLETFKIKTISKINTLTENGFTKEQVDNLIEEINKRYFYSQKVYMNLFSVIPNNLKKGEDPNDLYVDIMDKIKELPFIEYKNSYNAVYSNFRSKDENIEKSVEYVIQYKFDLKSGLKCKIDKKPRGTSVEKIEKLRKNLELYIRSNEDLKMWFRKKNNSKFTVKITSEFAGPEGLCMIKNDKELYLHGGLFYYNKDDVSDVMAYVVLMNLMRIKRDIYKYNSVLLNKEMVFLQRDIVEILTKTSNTSLIQGLVGQFKVLEQDFLMTKYQEQDLRTSAMLENINDLTDSQLRSFLLAQECA